jgi:hypothetical protein
MNKDTLRSSVNIIAFLLVLAVNGLANTTMLNGQTTGAVANTFKVYFMPAGFTFGIWGVIYLFLLGFIIYQALPAQRANPRLRRIGYLFALTCVANVCWLILWQYLQFPLTMVAMLVLLLTLIAIYLRLDIGRVHVPRREWWLVDVPFSLYLGWITVATIANATALLSYLGWSGWGIPGDTWAVIMLFVAVVIGVIVEVTRRDVAFLLVLVWAFIGIAVKMADTHTVSDAAWAATVAVGILAVWALVSRHRRPVPVVDA